MYVRLGFSVAIHTEPDILLVDEVLAVGDEAFAHKCLRRIEEMLEGGRTVLMVSHALSLIEGLCDRVLWLEGGRKRMVGEPRRVVDAYRQSVAEDESRAHLGAKDEREREIEDDAETSDHSPERWGSRAAEVRGMRMLDDAGEERYHFRSGETVVFEISAEARERLEDFVFGVAIATPRGVECWGTNTDLAGYVPASFVGSTKVRLVCPHLRLAPGEYLVDVAIHARDGAPYDYHRQHLSFSVTSDVESAGVYQAEHRWEFGEGIEWDEGEGSRENS